MAIKPRNGRPRFNSWPLYATLFILTLLATFTLFLGGPHLPSARPPLTSLLARAGDDNCDNVHQVVDQCAFVKEHCAEDQPGLLSYLEFYYCTLPDAKPVAFALLTLWLGLLFSTIGIAASDFFSINLSTIASVLGMPESLAGVTFLAFGNGSPDVFSTFAAMGSNSGSMAVGELIGAAGFITAVVAGSMALVREFKVSRKTFVRDIVFFILSVSFTMVFLVDGKLHMWECGAMIGFYVFYVFFVFAWQWFSARRRRRRTNEAASRSHYSVASSHLGDEVEPYHDNADEDEEDGRVGQRGRSQHLPDIGDLDSTHKLHAGRSQDDEEEARDWHVASEMTSSMRVNRPRGARTRSTIGPIRPSLVGALEFRSVMSSLTKSRNMRLAPLQRAYSDYDSVRILARSNTDPDELEPPYHDDPAATESTSEVPFRDRALSSGDIPRHLPTGETEHIPWFGRSLDASRRRTESISQGCEDRSPSAETPRYRERLLSVARRAIDAQERTRSPSPATSITVAGHLAPPDMMARPSQPSLLSPELGMNPPGSTTPVLSLQIPSPKLHAHQYSSQTSSPSLSPFPVLYESPILSAQFSALSAGRSHTVLSRSATHEYDHIPGLDPPDYPGPVGWWPYKVLPPPHVVWRTFLPTLQGWENKTIWDKIFSVVSIPNVFLLVITLPVVETDEPDEEGDIDAHSAHAPIHTPGGPGVHVPAIAVQDHAHVHHETEWQEYRRRSHSYRSRSSSTVNRKLSIGLSPETRRGEQYPFPAVFHTETPSSGGGLGGSEPTGDDDTSSWNRWLVVVQIFMGPLFTCFIIWAKYMDQPVKSLVRMILYSLLGSLVLLAILLCSTAPDIKPKYHFLFCYLGFVIAIAWISTIAEEVVGILKAVGVILGMSEAILGLTIFAVGNSVGDLVADITVARLGYPVMALSACFGGPMLNILLGIGLGGTYMTVKSAKSEHKHNPNKPMHYGVYHIDITGSLFISAITVLVTLVTLLIVVPGNKWMMTRKIGFMLIALWIVGTVVNVVVEVTGVWKAAA